MKVWALLPCLCPVGADERPWMNSADAPEERAKKLVAQMTLEEKLSLLSGSCKGYTGNVCGIERLGVPQQKYQDGPQGFRGASGTSTSWPSALTVAAAFDTDLMRTWGEAMGDEFYRKGANVQLGPGMCIARVPTNGRNFEYVSGEDPFLGYHMAKAAVSGIQSQGVVANAKHFVNNNQEIDRGSNSANVDERTQFEIYYPPFQGAIDAGVGSVMCSYNKECIDCPANQMGQWSCENHDALVRDLKGRLGFKGWVMSDWGATHSTSINSGLDQEMPGSGGMGPQLADAVEKGLVSIDKIDESAVRNMWPYFAVGVFDVENNNTKDNNVTSVEHQILSREIAAAGTVLLQNHGVLPISGAKRIAVVGDQAADPIVHGGGSGSVSAAYTAKPLESIHAYLGIQSEPIKNNCSDGVFEQDIDYYNFNQQSSTSAGSVEDCCALCAATSECHAFSYTGTTCWMKATAEGRREKKGVQSGICKKVVPTEYQCNGDVCVKFIKSNAEDVATAVADADVAIVFVGTSSKEGDDRGNLTLGAEDELIRKVAASAGKKTVVAVASPGALLTPWREDVGAILAPIMPGEEYGNAITEILFGEVNPSGRLPITFPNKENEMEMTADMYPGEGKISVYKEGLHVGYRWYNAHNVKPAFPFGHGLSYARFEYSELSIKGRSVSFRVQNMAGVDGAEVPQLYLGFPASAQEPPKQLKGFKKTMLKAGTSAVVTFDLSDRDLSIWESQPASKPTNNCSDGAFEQDVDYSNENLQTTAQAATVEECCALCGSNFDCNAFTFAPWGKCFMKANAEGRRSSSGLISGVCKKAPEPPAELHWKVVTGDFQVMVGASSEDIRLVGTLSNSGVLTV